MADASQISRGDGGDGEVFDPHSRARGADPIAPDEGGSSEMLSKFEMLRCAVGIQNLSFRTGPKVSMSRDYTVYLHSM